MFQIQSISIKNFLSIGNATQGVRFDENSLTLILGSNSDANGGTTRNGAGKSTILAALSYALYGQPLAKIKTDNLINNINGKAMMVTVDFAKDGKQYRIERGRRPNILRFYVNGEEMEDLSRGENAQTQIDISSIIGMSHTMFKHIVALNTYTEPFLKLGAAAQREVIEELLGVTQISARADVLKELIGQTKDLIKVEDAKITATKSANARIEHAIRSTEADSQRWQTSHDRMLVQLRESLEATADIDFDGELKKFDDLDLWRKRERAFQNDKQFVAREVEQMNGDLKRLAADRVRAVNDAGGTTAATAIERMLRDLTRARTTLENIETSRLHAVSEVTRFQAALDNPGEQECKTCGQELKGTDHLDYVVRRLTEDRDKFAALVITKDAEAAEVLTDIAEVEADIANRTKEAADVAETARQTIEQIDRDTVSLTEKRDTKSAALGQIDLDIQALGPVPAVLFTNRDEVYATKMECEKLAGNLERETAAINPFSTQVMGLQSSLQVVDMTPLNEAHELLKHQDFLLKLLTSKDSFIRRKIVEQNLHYLNVRLNSYLSKLGLPHEVVFQSDLSVEITLLGHEFDFAQLSRGESNRVIMATSWAFRDVWESLNHRCNLLAVDEILDNGTDHNGAEAALHILKEFGRNNRNVFLISHRDELVGRIDHILKVSKENGFTTITQE